MKRPSSRPTLLARRFAGTTDGSPARAANKFSVALGVSIGLVFAPLPVLAAPPKDAAPADAPAAEATVGGNVAILKFTGDDYKANDFRGRIQAALADQGYTAAFIKPSLEDAAKKNKCKPTDASCLDKIGAYLNKNTTNTYNYFAWAVVPADGVATVVIYDIANKKKAVEISMTSSAQDYILPEVVGGAVARRLAQTQVPAAAATEEELEILATLDEPEETPEEIAAREADLIKAMDQASLDYNAGVDVGEQTVDLERDFKEFCRNGPREDKEVEGDDGEVSKERDLRPACKRGPVFGYWQPRAWVALTLTLGSAATMGTMYGLAASSRGKWKTAKNNLDAAGLSSEDPTATCDADGACYADLAGEVSAATGQIRNRAIIGDVFLGATVLLTGVLAIIIYQDRQAAKSFISREKELKALSNLRLAPVFGETQGAALTLDF
ncbi:hypothetical protein DB30_02279 [Enhygromyxa salina]|uniref:Uncharacterized protein n=1 Tax=Enhygromyxa salina TaxID=215803 RepID=A0A0C2CL13_9BACT|nr:hypothetical protein [Enhygromyxa salina]KIG11921.1 hypothetical protein DB30_02279 [Enhygromyxa salina]